MEYDFRKIEQEWQKKWKDNKVYSVPNESPKPKYYVLDMFPYPSGAGLHVGHPLGYIASDIYSRYKRLKGFNVLHPMGFDSFGLPAEQYAIETGQHPAETTKKNIATFKSQLDKIGFCYDWEREVQTSDPDYYKWTQWIFLQLFNSYFCNSCKQAKPITELVKKYETKGSSKFSAAQWNAFTTAEKEEWLMQRRLAFSKYGEVNWCEALGTVLANDEVVNGVSERGGHPVVKKKMRQWYLRITAYADRLLEGLETVDFSDSMKDMQRNWIGKSEGAEIQFAIVSGETSGVRRESSDVSLDPSIINTLHDSRLTTHHSSLTVYTTRPDTIFGADFMVVAPELDLVQQIKTPGQTTAVDEYIAYVKSRSDVDRMAEKKITGCFTGAYAINPFNGRQIPVWISEYVLAGYGTGAIMAVPCGDERDFKFAQHFKIPITNIIGDAFTCNEANPTKEAKYTNSDFLNGMTYKEAAATVIDKLETMGIGKRKVNYRMRDAGFSRQRYWGEPFPIVWNGETPVIAKDALPLALPHVDKYGPGAEGESPLANITDWVNTPEGRRETSTMPGYAGSSWYFLRYMDPNNKETFCDRKVSDYWNQVDLYIGGTEHAVGHLLYSRLWTKVLFDLGYIGFDEPFKRLLNQGMIQGSSRFVHLVKYSFNSAKTKIIDTLDKYQIFISNDRHNKLLAETSTTNTDSDECAKLVKALPIIIPELEEDDFTDDDIHNSGYSTYRLHVDVKLVDGLELQTEEFKKWKNGVFSNAVFIKEEDGRYLCDSETEKMSKRYYNTFDPVDLCNTYGADTFRMYEMFLGPVEASKPWDTKGIEGVHRFLKKLWRLFNADPSPSERGRGEVVWTDDKPTDAEIKILHRTIKKIEEDTEKFSFNTAVSAFMICINDLADAKCHKKEILEKVLILLVPYAPHIAEELWHQLGNTTTILDAEYPKFNPALLVESSKEYPVSINGKVRTNITLALDLEQADVEKIIAENEIVQKWLEGKAPKRIIYVKNKMINVVV
jgi:leucyl-tRNA synthetase